MILASSQLAGNSVLPGLPTPCRCPPPPVSSPSRMCVVRSGVTRIESRDGRVSTSVVSHAEGSARPSATPPFVRVTRAVVSGEMRLVVLRSRPQFCWCPRYGGTVVTRFAVARNPLRPLIAVPPPFGPSSAIACPDRRYATHPQNHYVHILAPPSTRERPILHARARPPSRARLALDGCHSRTDRRAVADSSGSGQVHGSGRRLSWRLGTRLGVRWPPGEGGQAWRRGGRLSGPWTVMDGGGEGPSAAALRLPRMLSWGSPCCA